MKSKLTIGHFPIIDHLILGVAQYHDNAYSQRYVAMDFGREM